MRRLVTLGLLVLSLGGCATTAPQMGQAIGVAGSAVAVIPNQEREAVWHDAMSVLLDYGYVPLVIDEKSGLINARKIDAGSGDPEMRWTRVIVNIAPDGLLRVQMGAIGVFPSSQEMDAEVRRRQDVILRAILMRATARNEAPPNAALLPPR